MKTTHGCSRRKKVRPEYRVWIGMRRRCFDSTDHAWKDYGGRGISICKEWTDSFAAFLAWASSNGYRRGLQIDRIDNDKGYSPENCRFVTSKVNNNNRRGNVLLTAFGETKTISQWADDGRCSVTRKVIAKRIKAGLDDVLAITLPLQNRKISPQHIPLIRALCRRYPHRASGIQTFLARWFGVTVSGIGRILRREGDE